LAVVLAMVYVESQYADVKMCGHVGCHSGCLADLADADVDADCAVCRRAEAKGPAANISGDQSITRVSRKSFKASALTFGIGSTETTYRW